MISRSSTTPSRVANIWRRAVDWLFVPRNKGAVLKKEEAVSSSLPTDFETQLPPSKTPDDELADSLQALRHAIREKAKEECTSLRDEIGIAEQRLKAARELAKKLGISISIAAIANEMRHWYAWSKNEKFDFSKYIVNGLCYIEGKKFRNEKGDETTLNEFAFCGRKYKLTIANERYGYASGDKYADLSLAIFDGTDYRSVFAADIVEKYDPYSPRWHVDYVTAINVGEWLHDMVMLDELVRARKDHERTKAEADYILPKAKNLG